MLSSAFDMDIIHATSGAVYAIICSQKESYMPLANTLITNQTDPQNQTRLVEAFSNLTPPSLPLDGKRTLLPLICQRFHVPYLTLYHPCIYHLITHTEKLLHGIYYACTQCLLLPVLAQL
jgi:hypothetical protein